MSQKILPQKRSAALEGHHRPDPPSSDAANDNSNSNQRYTRLLSVLNKSLQQSRSKVESEAPELIKEVYGDMTSLFTTTATTGEDNDGVTQLVNLLLGKLDTVHDRFKDETTASSSSNNNKSPLDKLLSQHQIQPLLQRVESAISKVEKADEAFQQNEEADKKSAELAIQTARCSGVDAHKFTEYYTYQLKQEYLTTLQKELEEVTTENDKMDVELKEKWEEWMENLGEVKGALELLTQLGRVEDEEEDRGRLDP